MNAETYYPDDLKDLGHAVDNFVERVLRKADDSMFTPGRPVWTRENLTDLKRRFHDEPDESKDTFDEKLGRQLQGASDGVIQLMAEAQFVYFLAARKIGETRKLESIRSVLALMTRPVVVPEALLRATASGLASTGTFYQTRKPFQIAFLLRLALQWRALDEGRRLELLRDPWAFKAYIREISEDCDAPMRLAVLHFAFPTVFEAILSQQHRRMICKHFSAVAPNEPDEDRRIMAIRATLRTKHLGLYAFYRDGVEQEWNPKKDDTTDPPETEESVDVVADELCLDSGWLADAVELLRESRQLILYGPPGTGKTYIARRLARLLSPDCVSELVQFHPAYTYEDFVEGIRPNIGDGNATFTVRSGTVKRFAERARKAPTTPHVLVIDELNRANLPRVLGELLFLLEYRDEHVTLPYSGDRFSLPRNLFFVGTMNTADRSIALVDAAIRRRFAFLRLSPEAKPLCDVLPLWLKRHAKGMQWVAALLERANQRIADPDHAIGPSYFMQDALDEALLERIWNTKVLPYAEEYLHDSPEKLRSLELSALLRELPR